MVLEILFECVSFVRPSGHLPGERPDLHADRAFWAAKSGIHVALKRRLLEMEGVWHWALELDFPSPSALHQS